MKIRFLIMLFLFVYSVVFAEKAPEDCPAKFTAKVVDEEGMPLAGMSIIAGFYSDEPRQTGITDGNGLFVAECKKAMMGQGGFSVNHNIPGYYESHTGYRFTKIVNGRWEPWNPVVIAIVRRVINPIPMYVKEVETTIPNTNVLCGYDLEARDWVAPNGIGKQSDIFFRVDRSVASREDFELTFRMVFTNRCDGFQTMTPISESDFKSPRFANIDGYKMEYERKIGCKPNAGFFGTDALPDEYCAIRVRTILDEKGQIVSAYYGKITSGFRITGYLADKVSILFTYYLNPTPNDRNMEFDPKRNLFKDLKSTEEVTAP